MPTANVLYPAALSTSDTKPCSWPMWQWWDGKPSDIWVIADTPIVWWLRPVSSDPRVGVHSAVVWKFAYRRPFAASRSRVGVSHNPPKAENWPNPTSSHRITTTLGDPAGARFGAGHAGDDSSSVRPITPGKSSPGSYSINPSFPIAPILPSATKSIRCRPVDPVALASPVWCRARIRATGWWAATTPGPRRRPVPFSSWTPATHSNGGCTTG